MNERAAVEGLAKRPEIVVVGSINTDVVLHVGSHPAPGQSVLATGRGVGPGGKGANQAVAAARAGARVALVGCVGDDDAGRDALAGLAAAGVDTRAIRRATAPTGTAYVTVADGGENSIVVVPGANQQLRGGDVEAAANLVRGARLLVAQLEVPVEAVTAAVALAGTAGVPVLLNLAPAVRLDHAVLAGVGLLAVNQSEAATLLGGPAEGHPEELTRRLAALGPSEVVVTLGARGAAWRTRDGAGVVPAPRVDVVDTTGAGDAFVGSLAAAIVAGRSLPEAVGAAVEVASAAAAMPGARQSETDKPEAGTPPTGTEAPPDAHALFAAARVARLATADAAGRPHLVPIVFAVDGETLYSAVDAKPKRTTALRRLANVRVNPQVAVLADHYDDADWSRLWWARADGTARVLPADDAEARHAIDLLAARYPQHAATRPPGPVLAVDVTKWSAWAGWDLSPAR